MKIAKAMKHIARLKGKIADITNRINKCVSTDVDNEFDEKFADLVLTRNNLVSDLISLKDKVMKANIKYDKFTLILELAEAKNKIDMFKNLNIRNGKHNGGFSSNETVYKTQYTIAERNDKIEEIQNLINDITDELDVFNASTDI